jgi:hypothetical protein
MSGARGWAHCVQTGWCLGGWAASSSAGRIHADRNRCIRTASGVECVGTGAQHRKASARSGRAGRAHDSASRGGTPDTSTAGIDECGREARRVPTSALHRDEARATRRLLQVASALACRSAVHRPTGARRDPRTTFALMTRPAAVFPSGRASTRHCVRCQAPHRAGALSSCCSPRGHP